MDDMNWQAIILGFGLLLLGIMVIAYLIYAASMLAFFRKWYSAKQSADICVICPNCHQTVKLEWFLCNLCNALTKLSPDDKDILYHRCDCGNVLPKTNANGRNKLNAFCPKCDTVIGKNAGYHHELIFPIIGGPSSGKSAFLNAWIVTTLKMRNHFNFKISFPNSNDALYAKNCQKQWDTGIKPDKTNIAIPSGFVMDMVKTQYDQGLRVYCYDPAGMGDVLQKLEEHFDSVRCFSVSSFGHLPDTGERYVPQRVDRPIQWLIEKALQKEKSHKYHLFIK